MRLLLTAITAALTLGWPHPSAAQQLVQADVSGSLGWLHGNLNATGGPDHWYHDSFFGGGDFGWYWTDHVKTVIEAGVGSQSEVRTYEPAIVDNHNVTRFSRYGITSYSASLGQQYQFGENAVFHPFVGAGADLGWKRTTQNDEPLYIYGTGTNVVQPPVVHPVWHDFVVRPFASMGFKAYATPRAFFKTDLKFMFRGGVDEVVWRFGIGVDF
jgi:outer membrane protein W